MMERWLTMTYNQDTAHAEVPAQISNYSMATNYLFKTRQLNSVERIFLKYFVSSSSSGKIGPQVKIDNFAIKNSNIIIEGII